MAIPFSVPQSHRDTDAHRGSRHVMRGPSSAMANFRAACAPSNILLAGTVAFVWLALVTWTGAGPDSWQARLCADLTQQPRSCGAIPLPKDQSRVAPTSAVVRSMP